MKFIIYFYLIKCISCKYFINNLLLLFSYIQITEHLNMIYLLYCLNLVKIKLEMYINLKF